MKKAEILRAIVAALREEFETQLSSSKKTRAGGNDSESKAEGKYDTRSTEENYLADGLARQAQVSAQAAAACEKLILQDYDEDTPIDLGALVQLEFPEETTWFFLAPAGGGIEVKSGKNLITVLTPESPLGSQLLERKVGDTTKAPKTKILAVK